MNNPNASNTIEQNLIWLEQETKINQILSMSQETKAKLNVVSLAVSTIVDLTSMIKELKGQVDELKNEVTNLKSEVVKNKKVELTDEEKEILKNQAIEIINPIINGITIKFPRKLLNELPDTYIGRSILQKNPKHHSKYGEYQAEFIEVGVNYIVNNCKTIEQGLNVSNKLSQCIDNFRLFHHTEWIHETDGFHPLHQIFKLTLFEDYKIVYFTLYEMYRFLINKGCYCGMASATFKSLEDSGLDLTYLKRLDNPNIEFMNIFK